MKSLKNTLGINKNKKNINSLSSKLDLNAMKLIKGGEGEDYWPPAAPIQNPILPVLNILPN
jgi:hypothetical protein